ncbi:unnamed protein product, partial [marine sediment metagenome]
MKHTNKFGKILFSVVFILLFLPFNAKCNATIGDSTFLADEGDIYTWKCTYCSPNWSTFLGVGSQVDVNINRIYQGSYMGVGQALIVDVTLNYYI